MNWNTIEGSWKQFKGKVAVQWGRLTGDHIDVASGHADELAGKAQKTYGIAKDKAEAQVERIKEDHKH